jgi:hypothetical protein
VSAGAASRSNPFYLASAGCMLLGCYLLNDAGSDKSRSVSHLLPLLGCLTVYEIALIAVAAFLIARRALGRDGKLLLLIEAVFLVDFTQVSSEMVTTAVAAWRSWTWLFLAASLLLLGIAKLALATRLLRVPWRSLQARRLIFPALLVVALPGLFGAVVRSGASLDLPLYGASWLVALVLVVGTLGAGENRLQTPAGDTRLGPSVGLTLVILVPTVLAAMAPAGVSSDVWLYSISWIAGLLLALVTVGRSGEAAVTDGATAIGAFRTALSVMLPLSVVTHVLTAHWVYDVTFHPTSLSPVLLASAFAVTRSPHAMRVTRLRALVPALAVLFSLGWPSAFEFGHVVVFTPLRAVLAVAAAVYLYDFSRHRQMTFAVLGTTCGVAALLGPTFAIGFGRASTAARACTHRLPWLVPRTRQQWGACAVAAAYALLSVGAWLSTRAARLRTRAAAR